MRWELIVSCLNYQLPKITDILPKPQVQASQLPVHISYFLQNCKKGKPGEMDLPLLKNDITTFELALKYGIHSRNMLFSSKNWDG